MNRLLNLLPSWRERGWRPISATDYAASWHEYGGSVLTHPHFVAELSALAEIPVRYLGWAGVGGRLLGALASWGPDLALLRQGLKRRGKKHCFDLGNAEIILPLAPDVSLPLRFRANALSPLQVGQIKGLRPDKVNLAMVRPPQDYSKKFLYNQRRELRLFLEDGGEIRPLDEFSAPELASIYAGLFERRWGFAVSAKATLPQVFGLLRPYMTGSLLWHQGRPIAFQLLYQVESPGWISLEYINGGMDPEYRAYSPGSILSYLNIQAAQATAAKASKALRYSFGKVDRDYKLRWCHEIPVYRCP